MRLHLDRPTFCHDDKGGNPLSDINPLAGKQVEFAPWRPAPTLGELEREVAELREELSGVVVERETNRAAFLQAMRERDHAQLTADTWRDILSLSMALMVPLDVPQSFGDLPGHIEAVQAERDRAHAAESASSALLDESYFHLRIETEALQACRAERSEALDMLGRRLVECDAYQAKGIRDEDEIRRLEAEVEHLRAGIESQATSLQSFGHETPCAIGRDLRALLSAPSSRIGHEGVTDASA